MAIGAPEEIINAKKSVTGEYLKELLAREPVAAE